MQLNGNWFIIPSKNTQPTADDIANAVWSKHIAEYSDTESAGYKLNDIYNKHQESASSSSSSAGAFEQFRARAILEFHKDKKIFGKAWLERNGELWTLAGIYATGSLKFYNKSSSAIAIIPLSNPIGSKFFHIEDVSSFFTLVDEPVYFVEVIIGDVTSGATLVNEDIDYFSEQLEIAHGQGGTLII